MKTTYYNSKLAQLILFSGYNTIMFFGFILTKKLELTVTSLRHEQTHQRQYVECMILSLPVALSLCWCVSWWFILLIPTFYYLLYLGEWLVSFVYHLFSDDRIGDGKVNHNAYAAGAMEMEAKLNQDNPNYLNERKRFAWFGYYGKI